MKHNYTKLLNRSLLSKTLLTLALVLGSSQAWGQTLKDTYFDGTDSYETNWTTENFTLTGGELIPDGIKNCLFTSKNKITLASSDRIVITATKTSETGAQLIIKTSSDGSSYSNNSRNSFSNAQVNSSLGEIELLSDDINLTGDYYLQFSSSCMVIKSIKIYSSYTYTLSEDKATTFSSTAGSRSFNFIYTPASGWNTICTPFMIGSGASGTQKIFGSTVKAYIFSSYSENTLGFTSTSYIPSYTPCIVHTTTPQAPGASGFSFSVGTTYNVPSSHRAGGAGSPFNGAYFQGTYETKSYDALDPDWYGVTTDGQVLKAGTSAYVKGYRAYFTGISAATARIITIDDDGETTDLGFVKMVDPEAKEVYNLQGQRVEKGRKGIYIVNGRKVVIK